jgi:hypothetical protein
MRTLTFEQLRINLTLTFDSLDEPIEIVKRGRVVGYIVSNLQDTVLTGKSETAEKQPCNTIAAPEIVSVKASGDTVFVPDPVKPTNKPVSKPVSSIDIPANIQAKAEAKPWFRPLSKAGQCRNAGKGRVKT